MNKTLRTLLALAVLGVMSATIIIRWPLRIGDPAAKSRYPRDQTVEPRPAERQRPGPFLTVPYTHTEETHAPRTT